MRWLEGPSTTHCSVRWMHWRTRGYTDGFYERHHTHEQQNYLRGHSESTRQQYVGDIISCAGGYAEIDVKNKFQVGDRLEIIHPAGNHIIQLAGMRQPQGRSHHDSARQRTPCADTVAGRSGRKECWRGFCKRADVLAVMNPGQVTMQPALGWSTVEPVTRQQHP